MAKIVNHINYISDGKVYCRKTDSVVEFTDEFVNHTCVGCPMFAGTVQGQGVECVWADSRPHVSDPHIVVDPEAEKYDIALHDVTHSEPELNIKPEVEKSLKGDFVKSFSEKLEKNEQGVCPNCGCVRYMKFQGLPCECGETKIVDSEEWKRKFE